MSGRFHVHDKTSIPHKVTSKHSMLISNRSKLLLCGFSSVVVQTEVDAGTCSFADGPDQCFLHCCGEL